MNIVAGVEMVCISIGFFILCYLIIKFWLNCHSNKSLILLDNCLEDLEFVHSLRSSNVGISMACVDLRYAHSLITDFQFFTHLTVAFPKSVEVWFLFAKIVAIYPDQGSILQWIHVSLLHFQLKGFLAKLLENNIVMILRQRAMDLTPDVKLKIKQINKEMISSQSKLCRI
jgi:hypothetical protein